MRSRPSATRAWLPLSLALLAGCGGTASSPVRAVPTAPPDIYVRAEGTRYERGARPLTPVGEPDPDAKVWTQVAYRDGELRVSAFKHHCARFSHVEIEPDEFGVRRVLVKGHTTAPPHCEDEVRLRPGPDWTRATIAVPPVSLITPDPSLTREQERIGFDTAGLQPDRRTLLVGFTWGDCGQLAKAEATLDGDRIRISLVLGLSPTRSPGPCDLGATGGHTLVRLPIPAPAGARIVR